MLKNANPQLHIAVCDDEPMDRQQIADLTREIMTAEGLSCFISCYDGATPLLAAIQNGTQFHILLFDVMMGDLDGIGLAAALREMALRGYEVSAVRYLAKPLQPNQLQEALLHCYKAFCEKREILLPTAKGQRKLSPSDILYAESWKRGSRLWLTDGLLETSTRISELAAMLPERSFSFCHRTILFNFAFIKYLRSHDLELVDGKMLPVSKYRFHNLQKRL